MTLRSQLEQQVESLFARCPELCGFAVRTENDELFVSDVGITPRLSAEQYGEIFQDIARGARSRARFTNFLTFV